MTLTPEHVKLKELAEAIGPQTWTLGYNDARAILGPEDSDGDDFVLATVCDGSRSLNWHTSTQHCVPTKAQAVRIARYIAAANPSAILSLLKDLEEARAECRSGLQVVMEQTATIAGLLARAEAAERERDEANARAAVLGEALEHYACDCSDVMADEPCYEDGCGRYARKVMISLPAAAKALVENQRTPGTVEVCERHGYTMECADYVGREERPKFCSAAKCPLRSQQGKVNT